MCDFRWTALAEFHFYKNDIPQNIYCLCSRVFTWNPNIDIDSGVLSEENAGKAKELSTNPCSCTQLNSESTNNLAWQDYWSEHGERLIWESWIAKYGAYVNPDYDHTTVGNHSIRSSFERPDSLKLSFDSLSPLQDSSDYSTTLGCSINHTAEIESEDQKTISNEVAEKNRILVRNLSGSDSYDKLNREGEGWNPLSPISNDCETEIERLITSRCGSRTGSSSVTVDSMTNVTHMTISSIDLSESSKSSQSFSSVSSVHSSLTSNSSDDIEEPLDYQEQWNEIWTNHYEKEYLENYQKFLLRNEIEQTEAVITNGRTVFKEQSSETNVLSSILNLMTMDEDKTQEDTHASAHESEEISQMQSLGLPTSFNTKKGRKGLSCSKILKNKSDQSRRDRVHAAFKLIGLQLCENDGDKMIGSVNYKTKNITRQNNGLKINNHIHFDDDGTIVEEKSEEVTVQNSHQDELLGTAPGCSTEDESDSISDEVKNVLPTNEKRKRKNKNLPKEIRDNPKLKKFWFRRYSLFSKFDEGIKLDEESWFSVTPELIAKNTAERCQCDVVIDAFCGAGGNTIQLALTCSRVIAIDIDVEKINCARHNAQIYNVSNVEFIVGDFFQIAEQLRADVVFLSPPWGGVEYLNQPVYDLNFLKPYPLNTLLDTARKITSNICLFLPKNSNTYPLILQAGPQGSVELEQNFLNKRLVALTAYYGDLIKKSPDDT